MFTGIITDVGRVLARESGDAGVRFRIATAFTADGIAIGASIACAGPCLTVVEKGTDAGAHWFAVDVSPETLEKTTAATWQAGTRLNLERSLKIGDELGGHIVTGHVDGVAGVTARGDEGGYSRFEFAAPERLARYIAKKGSVALDGTSLTVNEADGARFSVMLIPHTLEVTTWGQTGPGGRVNIEVDLMARYAERLFTGTDKIQEKSDADG